MTSPVSPDPKQARPYEGLFDELPLAEREEAEECFARYISLALRIYARLERDPEAYAQFEALTDLVYRPTIHKERPTSPSPTSFDE